MTENFRDRFRVNATLDCQRRECVSEIMKSDVLLNSGFFEQLLMNPSNAVEDFQKENVRHVVGIDRGLRFLTVSYDEQGKTEFVSGKKIATKRHKFQEVRRQLQSKGTKSAKRRLKAISGRENRWMSDVNHQISNSSLQLLSRLLIAPSQCLQGLEQCA